MKIGTEWLACPFCGKLCPSDFQFVCTGVLGRLHPPIRLSWQWNSFAEYEAMYESDEYHMAVQEEGGQKAYDSEERMRASRRMASARLNLWFGMCAQNRECRDPLLRVMDIGAGNMAFVYEARHYFWCFETADGIDPHPLQQDCQRGTWRDVEGSYDWITLWDVIEHLTYPRECLMHLKGCMTTGGVISIETPEWDGPLHRKEGDVWRHHRPKQHVVLYSKPAIERLYDECGLEPILFYRPKAGQCGKMGHFLVRRERMEDG